ncbi:MAG: hypothetical protein IJ752_03735 [Alphaproteobacteria bacterium]|nr:hypothetical protein [Alphaproteobacteria bacterium]
MSVEFSMRQLLACLNISVFDPAMEPALKKVCLTGTEQREEQKDPFCRLMPQIGMVVSALICFWGLRAYSLVAGAFLFLICGIALRKTASYSVRYFLRTYFLTGLLLLTKACFLFSPVAVIVLLFIFWGRSLFLPEGRWLRTVLSVLFFGYVSFLAGEYRTVFLGMFSIAGTAGLLLPLKNVYSREPSIIFAVFSLLLLLGNEVFFMLGFINPLQGSVVLSIVFAIELLLLFCCLRRDLETEEIFGSVIGILSLFLVGLCLSVGIEGSAALFLVSFFMDCPALGKIAAVLFACFLLVFLLSLSVSLLWAGIISLTAGLFFEGLRFQLKLLSSKECRE